MANIFTLLKESVDPLIMDLNENAEIDENSLIAQCDFDKYDQVQGPEAAVIDLFAYKSAPAIIIGNRSAYETGTRDLGTGKCYCKRYNQAITIDEDSLKRIRQNQGSALRVIEKMVLHQMRLQAAYYLTSAMGVLINGLPSGNEAQDPNLVATLGAGDGGSLTDPYDLNATPGSAYNGSAIIFSGTARTTNVVQSVMLEAKKGLTKIDTTTNMKIPYKQICCGIDEITNAIISVAHDQLNSVSTQESPQPIKKDMEDMGVKFFVDQQFDSDYAGTSNTTSVMTFFTDPDVNIHVIVVPDGENENWGGEWDMITDTKGTVISKSYLKTKSREFGFYPQAYWIASADKFYKMVWRITVMPYKNT